MGLTEVRVRVRGREDEVGVLLGRRMRVTGDRGAAGGEWLDDACVSAGAVVCVVVWCGLVADFCEMATSFSSSSMAMLVRVWCAARCNAYSETKQ